MHNFIIYHSDIQQAHYLSVLVEGYFHCEVIPCNSFKNVSETIKAKAIELIIFVEPVMNDLGLISKLNVKKPMLCLVKGNQLSQAETFASSKLKVSVVNRIPKQIIEFITKSYSKVESKKFSEEFCRLRKSVVFSLSTAHCDIYFKQSDNKYLRVFKKLDTIDVAASKIHNTVDEYFYVKDSDFAFFLHHITSIKEENPIVFQELFHELANKLGINEVTLNYANQAMSSFVANIEGKRNIKKVWDKFVSRKNYLSEHSFITAFISNSILANTRWRSGESTVKLCMAALFHDIAFKDLDISLLELKTPDEWEGLSQKRKDELRHHPMNALKLLEDFDNLPLDVDKIITQHHEKYDGSGYPRNMSYLNIIPLAAIFIVAHEITTELFEKEFSSHTLVEYIKEKKPLYLEGAFKDAINALEKIFVEQ